MDDRRAIEESVGEVIFRYKPEVNERHQFWWRLVMIVLILLMTGVAFGKYAAARYDGTEMSVSVVIGIIAVGVFVFGGSLLWNDLLHRNRKAFHLRITSGGVLHLETRKGSESFHLRLVDFVQIRDDVHSAQTPHTSTPVRYLVRYLVISHSGKERKMRIPGGYAPPGDGRRTPEDKVREFVEVAGRFTRAEHIGKN